MRLLKCRGSSKHLPGRMRKPALKFCLCLILSKGLAPESSAAVAHDTQTSSLTNFVVDTQDRAEVRTFFNAVYFSGTGVRSEWNGNVTNCEAGATRQDFQKAVLTRINFFRAMAGVPADITFDPVYSAKAQQA